MGPIRNPLSAAPVPGFEIETLSKDFGKIAVGTGELTVSKRAEVPTGTAVSLTASQTLINQQTSIELEIQMPVPLNAGCLIDVFIPKPLSIGPELSQVTVGGMFGSLRPARINIDATNNKIKIDGACLSFR